MIYGNTEGNQLWFYLFLNRSQSTHGSSAGSKVEGNCGVRQDLRVLDQGHDKNFGKLWTVLVSQALV